MRLDGMDAAAKISAVPAGNTDQPPVKAEHSADAKFKTVGFGDQAGISAVRSNKNRGAQDAQAYELKGQQQEETASEKVIRDVIDRANKALSGSDRKFVISFHEKTRDIMIKVLDTKTNETIREIPPKKIIDLVVSLCEMAGILYDKKG